ncbi:MAG: TIGR00730 family Rossman fold protein, partial [Alphaproteobacteria bacterium]|nr:TIGR00730 family Rossman fold protein [Alphaproteobacteria bacterium]
MSQIKSVCVYCGSSTISDPVYNAPTELLGQSLAAAGITLVYGGGNPGLMGKVANSCMAAGGSVIGIIPDSILKLEARHDDVTEL